MVGVVLEGVRKTYPLPEGGYRPALLGVDLEVQPGEFLAILGPSGCGKTTLLNLISGLDPLYEGRIRFLGTLDPPRIGYVFQEPRLLPWLKVWENLAFALGRKDRQARERIHEWLDRLGLADYFGVYPGQLSLGQQQRVAVARALLLGPQILLMDEPTSALDELTAMGLREELLRLWEGLGCTVLYVTHNPLEAVYLSDRVAIMVQGRVASYLSVRPLLPRPRSFDDQRVWEVSRQAVALLRREALRRVH